MKEHGILQKIATLSAFVLWAFILFVGGIAVSQTDMFIKTWQDARSGKLEAELLPYAKDTFDKQMTIWKTTPDALLGGAMLIGSHYTENPALFLIDAEGHILHSWQVEPKITNPEILHAWEELPTPSDTLFAIDDVQLMPDGGVIFIQDMRGFDNFRGQRLARMDKDSHILWQVTGAFTHEFEVTGTPPRIYTMVSHMRDSLPIVGPKLKNVLYLNDVIEVYTLDGKKTDAWSVTDAFARSRFSNLLNSFEIDLQRVQRTHLPHDKTLYDILHMNSIQVLDAAEAKALPMAVAGDILISLRGLNAIAVLRPSTQTIVWASKGPWSHQHYVRADEKGQLYIFDNEGAREVQLASNGEPVEAIESRVIRYNPFTNLMDVIYGSTQIHSPWRGYYFPLPNGTWIVGSPETSRIEVIGPNKDILWELRGVQSRSQMVVPYRKKISTMRYYPPSALGFLHTRAKAP